MLIGFEYLPWNTIPRFVMLREHLEDLVIKLVVLLVRQVHLFTTVVSRGVILV